MGWADKFKGAVGAVRDSGASAAVHRWLSRELEPYGEVLDFDFNSGKKTAEMHVLLKGETEKLTVHVRDYELVRREDGDFIVVKNAGASREWVNAVLRNFVINKPHRIPEQYSAIARMVLNA